MSIDRALKHLNDAMENNEAAIGKLVSLIDDLNESPIEETDLATARESLVGLPLWKLAIMAVENGQGVESVLGDAIDFATKEKVDGYVAVIERMAVEKRIADATVDAIMTEMVARQQKRSADFAKGLETVKDRALSAMRLMPCWECNAKGCKVCKDTGHRTLLDGNTSALQANKVGASLNPDIQTALIPKEFKTVTLELTVPFTEWESHTSAGLVDRYGWGQVETKIDKAAILKALKAGREIPGARLVTDRLSLVVK